MEEKQLSDKRFALLIDADNVSAKYIKPIMDELSKYGTVTIKRIYGDWTLTLHAKWKDALLENSITPIQQFGYTQGKNATDSAMIIDAMDILYTDKVDGFCIVSSDSDFTRLAARLRESGLTVIGMGEKKTPVPFRKACDIFTTLELLLGGRKDRDSNRSSGQAAPKDAIEQAVVDIITDNQNNGKSTGLGEVGSRLLKRYPDFDVRSYGTNLLSKLLGEFERVQITKRGSNVSVELAEDKAAHESENESSRRSRRRRSKEAAGATAATATEQGEAADEQDEPATQTQAPTAETDGNMSDPPAKQSRRRRSRKRAEEGQRQPAEGQHDEKGQPDAEHAAEGQPEESKGTTDEATSAKPKASTRSRRRKATPPASEAVQEATQKPGPAAADERPTSPAAAGATSEGPASTTPAAANAAPANLASTAATTEATKATKAAATAAQKGKGTPETFVRQQIHEAGAAGVNLNELGKQVRAKFRAFKLRDLGYTQFRRYVADLDDIIVEKQGGEYIARLGE